MKFVLIESDWNLKYAFIAVVSTSTAVLIESDWNLKFIKDIQRHVRMLVLIESDWNLKGKTLSQPQ